MALCEPQNGVCMHAGDLLERVDANVEALASKLGGVEAKVEALASKLGGVEAKLEAKVEALASKLGGVEAMLIGIKAGQDNVRHRNFNGMNRLDAHELQLIKAETGEKVGQYPPPELFPATLELIASLNKSNLDALAKFYGITFEGQSLAARRANFKCFIGAS